MHCNKETEFLRLKGKIKAWECSFLELNGRKPQKEDISSSPLDVKEAYRNFWKLHNNKETSSTCKDDVWSVKFNKSHPKASCETVKRLCHKIQEKSCTKYLKKSYSSLPRKTICSESEDQTDSNLSNNYIADECFGLQQVDTKSFPSKLSENIIRFQTASKPSKNVSFLSPLLNSKSLKQVHFNQDIDNEWLNRCEMGLVNDSFKGTDMMKEEMLLHILEDNSSKEIEAISMDKSFRNLENVKSQAHFGNDSLKSAEKTCDMKACPAAEVSELVNNLAKLTSIKEFNESKIEPQITDPEMNHKTNVFQAEYRTNNNSKIDLAVSGETKDGSFKNETKYNREERRQNKRKLSNVYTSEQSDRIKRKISSGTLNENYVQINIKKKKFSRGHKSVNIKKLKWNKWKQLKKNSASNSMNMPSKSNCFKCGQLGHWAKQCPTNKSYNSLSECEDTDDLPLPTLAEAAALAREMSHNGFDNKHVKTCISDMQLDKMTESKDQISEDGVVCSETEFFCKSENNHDIVFPNHFYKPVYSPSSSGKPIKAPKKVFDVLNEMGYSDFRKDQELVIMRILCGLSTLVILPTGSGKSLCYQLPAYMYAKHYGSIALVISPLVSLMEDQITGLPSCLRAVCLHSGMTDTEKQKSLKDISEGVVHILLVSPEAVIGRYAYSGGILPSNMPSISFACIDEVHCLSQWSHNFRPSYLQLYKVLTRKFGVKCILGLTATANQSSIKGIISHLGLEDAGDCVVGHTEIPLNLHISVSRDKDKDQALIKLLKSDRFCNSSSIIIYCIRRIETERLASLIRTSMQDDILLEQTTSKSKSKKRCFNWTVEAYHAGLTSIKRRSIQKRFMNGKLRVIIATIAFGMGLDKPDVRAVIHYNMPKSFESYVQEIGRAGRDGLKSDCHLFLDCEEKDLNELQRHIYANGIDRHTIRKLLSKVFSYVSLNKEPSIALDADNMSEKCQERKCLKQEIAFPINETVLELDMKEENISTLLCYMELNSRQWIEVLPPCYATCTIHCYKGARQMQSLARKCPAIAVAFALDSKNGKKLEKTAHYQFPLVKVASYIRKDSTVLKKELKRLQWNEHNQKSGVLVSFSDLAFHLLFLGNIKEDEQDNVLEFLHKKVSLQEKRELHNLTLLYSLFHKYSFPHYWSCCDQVNMEYSNGIKEAINKYFEASCISDDELQNLEAEICIKNSQHVDVSNIRAVIQDIIFTHKDENFTARAIARILHGISSPCFPSDVWGRVRKFWRCFLHVKFSVLLVLANEELRKYKVNQAA